MPRTAFVSTAAIGDAKGGLIGGLAYVGATVAVGAVVMSGGALAVTIAAAILAGGTGGLIGSALAHWVGHHHAAYLHGQIENGGLLLWVRAWDEFGRGARARDHREACSGQGSLAQHLRCYSLILARMPVGGLFGGSRAPRGPPGGASANPWAKGPHSPSGRSRNWPSSSKLAFRKRARRRSGVAPLLVMVVRPQEREMLFPALNEPYRLGSLPRTGLEEHLEHLCRPGRKRAGIPTGPASRCRGGKIRRVRARSVIIHLAA